MKNISKIIVICFIACITFTTLYSCKDVAKQGVKTIAKTSAKKTAKEATKKGVKAGTKQLIKYTSKQNAKILKKYAKKIGMSDAKRQKLLSEMDADDGLANLIHSNPKFNMQRWLNTRNHVDKNLIVKTSRGDIPKNARVYAGNVYYFNPHLNSGLNARLKRGAIDLEKGKTKLDYDDFIKLDKMFPDGVPFTKQGYPDFSKVAAKNKNGSPIIMDIKKLSGSSQKDISMAETMFQKAGNKWEDGWTWHHIENSTKLMRVPSKIHDLVRHSGGMSTM